MFRIIHEKEVCIGCGACAAVCPKLWEMGDDGKSHIKGGKSLKQNEIGTKGVSVNEVLEVAELGCAQESADVCPVNCIHVKKK
jgi:ferredoxin